MKGNPKRQRVFLLFASKLILKVWTFNGTGGGRSISKYYANKVLTLPSNIALNPAFATSAESPFSRRFEHPALMAAAISFRYET
jgi:hypothetical protein